LTGESGKDPVIRHSIIGKGILLTSSTLIIFSAIIGAFLYKKNNDKLLPFLLMIFLYPFTDVIFTKDGKDPYSFAVFAGLFFLPYLFGFGLDYLGRLSLFKNTRATAHIKISFLLIFVTIVSVIEGLHFYLYTYERYPLISSGYWGWQSGPREMVSFYIQNKSGYDEFIMSNQFNESESLLKFYLIDNPELMSNAKIGSVDNYNPTKKQLFGLSSQQFIEEVKDKYNTEIEEVIYYPNFEPSFYLFTVNEPFLTI
jgi:hypothetical protein